MKKANILYSSGQLDCLSYYIKIFSKLKSFLGDREIATKTFIPKSNIPFIIHRGSKDSPLHISDLLKIKPSFLKLRVGKSLHEVENQLSEKEKLIWRYFVPRKLIEMHYACNYEKQGKPINRIFIDIDKGEKINYSDYMKVVNTLVNVIKIDKEFKKTFSYKMQFVWTGKSIHVYLLLDKKYPNSFYNKYFSFAENSFISKWAKEVTEQTKLNVSAGHERNANKIILDTSATPLGKLARCPYSLHLSSKGELDGVSRFLREKELGEDGLVERLLEKHI